MDKVTLALRATAAHRFRQYQAALYAAKIALAKAEAASTIYQQASAAASRQQGASSQRQAEAEQAEADRRAIQEQADYIRANRGQASGY